MLISNSLLNFRRQERAREMRERQSERDRERECVSERDRKRERHRERVCLWLWQVRALLDLSWVKDEEPNSPRDNPSGVFPHKHMWKNARVSAFSFPPTIAINIFQRTFAHVPLRTGIPTVISKELEKMQAFSQTLSSTDTLQLCRKITCFYKAIVRGWITMV